MPQVASFVCLAWVSLAPVADFVVIGGKFVTLDPQRPHATALAAADGRIVAVGGDREIEPYIGPDTRVLRLNGELVTPGFIEGHGHFTALGRAQTELDLTGARDWDEIVQQVSRAAQHAPPGRWIVGRGWHQSKWRQAPRGAVEGYPPHDELSAVTPRNPVVLSHASGHLALANAEAMRRANVTRDTPDPEGGQILHGADGEPIGVFRETAENLIWAPMAAAGDANGSPEAEAAVIADIERAGAECLAHGVTSFHDAGSPPETVELFAKLADEQRLPVRLYVMLRGSSQELAPQLARLRSVGRGEDFLTVRAIKAAIDGALGAHGAWLLEPYADLPASRGLNTTPLDEMQRLAELARQHDYQLCVHAIGDRANRETLDLFKRVGGQEPKADRRWRIEHAQHLSPDDIPRFAKLGVIASMQAIHATSDAPFVVERLGEERAGQGAYVWRALWDSGALVTNGTDTPVEKVDPMACLYAAVTRRPAAGASGRESEDAFFPGQCLTREEALRSYTLNNARAAFEEDVKGSLTPGKVADLVVWSDDFLTIPAERIPSVRAKHTIVGGKVRYSAD